jgi:uncharacterized membrane protein
VVDQASERIRIAAPAAQVWQIAIDFEQYPKWVRDIKRATVLERDAEGRGTLVEYRAAALGKSITYVLAYDFSQAPVAFSWRLVRGDLLRRLDGTYRLEAEGDATRVHYELYADLAAPLPGVVKRRATSIIMGSALRDLKRHVEASGGAAQ